MPKLNKFEMPKGVAVEKKTKTSTYAKIVSEPFEGGFGHTLGNALRRVLLSSLEGAAITSVKIDGVAHEFSTIPGIYEDVTHIILNLKKILFDVTTRKSFKCELKAKSESVITAGMIKTPAGVEIVNKDYVICTANSKADVNMEFNVAVGTGFRPAELNKSKSQPIGLIPIDSLFSPIEKVKYSVGSARLGVKTDYDKLILEIWSDGRIDPLAAVVQASELLIDHFNIFAKAGDPMYLEGEPEEDLEKKKEEELANQKAEYAKTTINDLGLSKRTTNALITGNIANLNQLIEKTDVDLLAMKNFGQKAINEVKDLLDGMSLALKKAPTTEDEIAEIIKKGAIKK